jgi:hypothetical protein
MPTSGKTDEEWARDAARFREAFPEVAASLDAWGERCQKMGEELVALLDKYLATHQNPPEPPEPRSTIRGLNSHQN